MPPEHDEPLPVEAIRDLLGIVRAAYAAYAAYDDTDTVRRAALGRIGKDLAAALDLSSAAPGSLGYASARRRADRACAELGEVVGVAEAAQPIVLAAMRQILG